MFSFGTGRETDARSAADGNRLRVAFDGLRFRPVIVSDGVGISGSIS